MSTLTFNPATDPPGNQPAARPVNPIHNSTEAPLGGARDEDYCLRRAGSNPIYPNAFPVDQLMLVGQSLINKEIDKKQLAYAAWTVSGYILGTYVGTQSVDDSLTRHQLRTSVEPETPEDKHKLLTACATNKAIPQWVTPLVIQVLETVLTNV